MCEAQDGGSLSIKDAVRAAFDVVDEAGDEWIIRCPVHEDARPSAEVYVGPAQRRPDPKADRLPGMWYCFACGAKGKLDLEDVSVSLEDVQRVLRSVMVPVAAPTIYSHAWFQQYITSAGRAYWGGRGFHSAERQQFMLGHDGSSPVYGMVDHASHLLGVVQRTGGRSKYRYPAGVSVHAHLFASRFVQGDTVALTEGAVDAMALWQVGYQAVAQYGATLSLSQVSLLRRMGITTLLLAYDADETGEYARERVVSDHSEFFLVRHLRWRGDAKDPAEIPTARRHSALYVSRK